VLKLHRAAKTAMTFLRAGGSAVDAVEAAIRVLEDKEITNAGYGSNLTMEGVVECDATVVDYLGRSGACGATASECIWRAYWHR
jgi:taspase (threonine aspartase 1)